MKTPSFLRSLIGAAVLASAPGAFAITVDLTTAGATGTINGAIFDQILPRATGTGVINSFVEIGDASPNTGTEVEAFNTTVNGVLDNGSSDIFNHELTLAEVPIVNIGGTDYRQFMLDINQLGSDPLLSLDGLTIYQSGTANFASFAALIGGSTQIWDMGANWIKLDYNLNTGSGSGDMFAYIPNSLFNGQTYVYLYSKFGVNENNNDGFEEWAVTTAGPIPEPGTYALMLAGLGAIGFMARRRRQG